MLTVCLASCATKRNFEVLQESASIAEARLTRKEFHQDSAAIFCANNARNDFIASCKEHAAKTSRQLEMIALTSARLTSSKVTGYYSSVITGRMKFGREPFQGVVTSDNSGLMEIAAGIQESENDYAARSAHRVDVLNAMTQTLQRQNQIDSQNTALRSISSSIDRNTNAIMSGRTY